MCTNRALTDLYAFSARFIQLLNRKLAYVCIADYYKSEQNVLFCLTLIIIFMKKHFFGRDFSFFSGFFGQQLPAFDFDQCRR